MLDVVPMHDIVVYICFYDVSMKFIHARIDGLDGRILGVVLLAYIFP